VCGEKRIARKKEIVTRYLQELDQHLGDLKNGRAEKTFEIKDLAKLLFVHPRHLSNTIQEVLGNSPCNIYESRLREISKELMLNTQLSIAQIAKNITFDPSNFSKFFKSYEGMTPGAFRRLHKNLTDHRQ